MLLMTASAIFMIAACGNDDMPDDDENTPKLTTKLEVTVEVETDTGLVKSAGAKIYLFDFKEYRDAFTHIAYEGSTDANGIYTFSGLENNEYWIVVKLPQPDGRFKNFYDDFPFPTPVNPNVLLSRLLATFEKG